jgi:hypothetical protein
MFRLLLPGRGKGALPYQGRGRGNFGRSSSFYSASELQSEKADMSNRDGTRVLFDRIWSAGVQAAREGRHRELDYLVHMRPSLEEYQAGRGLRMTHMIKVVQLGMSRLRAAGDLPGE